MNGRWNRTELAGRVADEFTPAEPAAGTVLFLHGYDLVTLKDNPAWSGEFARQRLRVVCPHGGPCWWTDVICPEFSTKTTPLRFLHEELVPVLKQELPDAGLALLGIEMGGQGVLQLAYRFPRDYPVVAAVSPIVDFQNWYGHGLTLDTLFPDAEAARQETVVLKLHPLNWPRHQLLVCDPADAYCSGGTAMLASKLASTGIPFEQDFTTTQGGFGWDYWNRMAPAVVRFLAERMPSVVV
jgi:S-formylglutathione hydrolase